MGMLAKSLTVRSLLIRYPDATLQRWSSAANIILVKFPQPHRAKNEQLTRLLTRCLDFGVIILLTFTSGSTHFVT